MKVLVTGGAGYIGSHICKALALAGIIPVAVDNLGSGHRWAVKWGPFYKADLRDTEKIIEIIRAERVQSVLHLAALAVISESQLFPLKYYQNNVLGSMSLLGAMRATGVTKVVFSSTCATYGVATEMPITESCTQAPINSYGSSKLFVERILKDFAEPYGLASVALRYFNAGGADPDLEIGEAHDPESHLIPLALDVAFGRRPHLTIYGADYPTADGTCIRDYIHVNDLADAHLLALQRLTQPGFEAFNLGSGAGYSVKQMITEVEKITGNKVHYQIDQRRPGDPPVLVATGQRAQQFLGWSPKFSQIEDIISTAANWHKKHYG